MTKFIKKLISVGIIFAAAGLFVYIMLINKAWPHGNDVYGHFFKIRALYEQIGNKNFYPIYNENWYSGLELFRYWPPASYYFYAFIAFFTGGDVIKAFPIFAFIVNVIGALGFLLFADRDEDKHWLCTFLGVLYIYLPDNLKVFFSEGNIPRIFITMLLPYLFFFICDFIENKNNKAIIGVNIISALIVSAHIMIAAMVGLTAFLFSLLYALANKKFLNSVVLLLNMVLSYVMMGIILVPGLFGGLTTQSSQSSMDTSGAMWSRRAIESLNPALLPINPMDFYFGLSVFLLLLTGILVWHRKTLPYFGSAFLIFFGTTMIVLPIISALPMSQAFWMTRFIPMAYNLILIGIMEWTQIKRSVRIVLFALIVLDCIFAFAVHAQPDSIWYPTEEKICEDYLLDEAMELTDCRIAFMDLSNIGSYTSYVITKDKNNVDSLFGWAYQGAYTINEIVELNEAFETGYYDYVFDRLIRYGCDTVVLKKNEVKTNYEGFLEKAAEYGYELKGETEKAVLFDFKYDGKYGTVFNYENVCIGVGSEYMSYLYPSFYKLRSNKLDDYSYDELKNFKRIYITGPEYKDKEYCEEMLMALSDAGVKIYIDMNRLPLDKSTGRNSLLGVVAQPIVFNNEFPILAMDNGSEFKLSLKDKSAFKEWRTVYFTNLKDVTKTARYSSTKYLPYLGTSPNKNITFIGLNLVYFQGCSINQDSQLYDFLDEVFKVGRHEVPERTLVPLKVKVKGNDITIDCGQDNVLTGIANLDSFVSVSELGDETFVMANEGITNIHTTYAYFKEGLICSILGFLLLMPVMIYTCVAYPMDGYVHTPLMLREEKPDKKVSEEQTEETPEKVTSQDMSFIDKEYMDMMEDEEKEGVEKSEENADINIEKSKQAENAGGSDDPEKIGDSEKTDDPEKKNDPKISNDPEEEAGFTGNDNIDEDADFDLMIDDDADFDY